MRSARVSVIRLPTGIIVLGIHLDELLSLGALVQAPLEKGRRACRVSEDQ
jgi:hypothetical protein